MVSCNKLRYMKLSLPSLATDVSLFLPSLATDVSLFLPSLVTDVSLLYLSLTKIYFPGSSSFFMTQESQRVDIFWERNSRVRVALNFIPVIFVTRFVIQLPLCYTHSSFTHFHLIAIHINSHVTSLVNSFSFFKSFFLSEKFSSFSHSPVTQSLLHISFHVNPMKMSPSSELWYRSQSIEKEKEEKEREKDEKGRERERVYTVSRNRL